MSRRSGEILRKNFATKRERSDSPRTSVYDRLGPQGSHISQCVKGEDTCRYILKSGHCRFGEDCSYNHGPIDVILGSDTNVQDDSNEIHSPIIHNCSFLEKNKQNDSHIDGKVSSSNFNDRRSAEFSQIKDNIRRHISRSSKLRTSDISKHINSTTKKNTKTQVQMGSVVHRGSKNTKFCSLDELVLSKISCRIEPATKESLIRDLSLNKEPSLSSDSCHSGDEQDSSTDSISDNDGVIQDIQISGMKSREKALSSISESSFSSVPSTDRKASGKKKRSLLISNRKLEGVKDIVFDHKLKLKKDTPICVTKFDIPDIHVKGPENIIKMTPNKSLQLCSHKFSKKHCKRKSYSHSEEGSKFRKEHNKDKKRNLKSNSGSRIDSTRSDIIFKTKADNVKKIRLGKKIRSREDFPDEINDSISNAQSITKENSYPGTKLNPKDVVLYHQNETKNESSINNRSELSNNERNTATLISIPHSFELSKSIEFENTSRPQINQNIPDIITKSDIQDKSADAVLSCASSESYNVADHLSLKIHLKRKQNRKFSENLDKKAKKNEDSLNKIANNPSKNPRNNKNKFVYPSTFISQSLSPVTILKDGFEIYDSLSDLEQGIILDEDLSTEASHRFTNDSNVIGIEWGRIEGLHSCNHANYEDTLLSQLGISYSLLDADTIMKFNDITFNDIPIHCNIQIRPYLQELSMGSFIEDFLFLEREKLSININSMHNTSLIKNSDIQFRKIVSGFRNVINLNPVNLPPNPHTSKELFTTAVSIYHKSVLSKND